VSYGVADGMKSSDCTGVAQPAGSRGRDGRLWFPTARGVVAVDPRRIPVNALVPPVKIEQVVVDGEPAKSLEFAPGHERWELQYTALTFLAPRKVQFRYRLEGFDADWVPAGTRRTAYYTRLPPGRYTFRVVAANNDGVWNEEGDAVELKVQPYVHQTGWFYALCSVGLMLSGAGVYALRVRSLHAHRRELESLVEARTSDLVREKEASEEARSEAERQKEIAEQADRLKGELLSIAAHDLKTPLQSIIGYADLIAEVRLSAEAIREYAGYSARAAERMLHIVNRLLQSDAIEQGHLRPGRDAVELGRLALAVASALGPLAEAKKQRIHAAAEDSCLVEGDEDWLRQVLENLIGNAIK
jgi:signal transduction histidine kinase